MKLINCFKLNKTIQTYICILKSKIFLSAVFAYYVQIQLLTHTNENIDFLSIKDIF